MGWESLGVHGSGWGHRAWTGSSRQVETSESPLSVWGAPLSGLVALPENKHGLAQESDFFWSCPC